MLCGDRGVTWQLWALCGLTVCIVQGTLFPMCGMNLAFNRELIGPAMYFGLMGEGYPIGRYDDMWAGWCVKVMPSYLNRPLLLLPCLLCCIQMPSHIDHLIQRKPVGCCAVLFVYSAMSHCTTFKSCPAHAIVLPHLRRRYMQHLSRLGRTVAFAGQDWHWQAGMSTIYDCYHL